MAWTWPRGFLFMSRMQGNLDKSILLVGSCLEQETKGSFSGLSSATVLLIKQVVFLLFTSTLPKELRGNEDVVVTLPNSADEGQMIHFPTKEPSDISLHNSLARRAIGPTQSRCYFLGAVILFVDNNKKLLPLPFIVPGPVLNI